VAVRPYHFFSVVPQLPQSLEKLRELAWNLRFSWDPATMDLFRMMDADLFEACGRNPVLFLGRISQARLEQCAEDDAILANLQRVWSDYSKYMSSNQTWFAKTSRGRRPLIAYFSAEFGLAGCMPLYSGGLGVLAGDHLKSASDLGLPLVGLGLLYQRGYFHQYLNSEGWQQESYPVNDFHNMPIRPARSERGEEVLVTLPLGERTLHVKVWRADVGRVPLYLLDTNIIVNDESSRSITSDLYGGDTNTRLRQEYVLGIGGVRALAALGRRPDVCHMNEGHSAFLALERVRMLMEEDGLDFASARLATAASNVFTTHTPVRAAIDLFGPDQMEALFRPWRQTFGLSRQEFMDLGRESPGRQDSPFNMAVFALRMADAHNGVSRLHAHVSRKMWSFLWPQVPAEEVPITSVTNGVHTQTWISRGMRELLDRNLGPRWSRDPASREGWEGIEKISPDVLWRTHELQRQRLVTYVRDRMRDQLEQANATAVEIAGVHELLDAGALTIGFARRFAPYKRASLILRDPDRLQAILCDSRRPVQIIFAGKAHPRDEAGKKLIQDIVRFSRLPRVKGHVVFIEDYDMEVAKHLVQGVDVWLNTPRRPLEASGTSGMKSAANGVLNVSVLDGWWDEAAAERLGWSIGQGEVYDDPDVQDHIESSALYDLLEHEIVPLFYDRGRDGLPRGWIRMMKEALKGLCPVFNTNRMVHEYATRCYLPAVDRYSQLADDSFAGVRALAAWRERVQQAWDHVRILEIEAPEVTEFAVGDTIAVRARVSLGGLEPGDVDVQLYHGEVEPDGAIAAGEAVSMVPQNDAGDGAHWYSGEVPCPATGRRGYALRVLPRHAALATAFLPGLIRWDVESLGHDWQPAPAGV
jgi:starch phosphorylase